MIAYVPPRCRRALAVALVCALPALGPAQTQPQPNSPAVQFGEAREPIVAPAPVAAGPAAPALAPTLVSRPAGWGGLVDTSFAVPAAAFRVAEYGRAMDLIQRPPSRQRFQDNLFDRQRSAVRPNNAYLDRPAATFLPAIPVAGVAGQEVFYDKFPFLTLEETVRGDVVFDSRRLSDPTAFRPSVIPVRGQDFFGAQPRVTVVGPAEGTTVYLEANGRSEVAGPAKAVVELQFGPPQAAGPVVQVLHLYAQVNNIFAGQVQSLFSDTDAIPNTIDTNHPSAMALRTHPAIGYLVPLYAEGPRSLYAAVSIEQPEATSTAPASADATKFASRSRVPDVAARVRLTDNEWGHVQVASIVRDVGIENTAYTTGEGAEAVTTPASHQDALGWGLQLTGEVYPFRGWDLLASDYVLFGGVYGRGIADYIVDLQSTTGLGAAFDANDRFRPLPVQTYYLSYTHFWTVPGLRSTVVYSQANLDTLGAPGLTETTYRQGRYFAANLIYQWDVLSVVGKTARLFTGLEYLYGHKETQDGETGDAHRVRFTFGSKF